MKLKGGYCYNCDKHYNIDELGVDEYYKVKDIRKGTQVVVGNGLYCKDCDSSNDLIILVNEEYEEYIEPKSLTGWE